MEHIRPAEEKDFGRIAEIEVFNYRLNFYPIFRNDEYYFSELSVAEKTEEYKNSGENFFVYDDKGVKGFVMLKDDEIKKLFVEPVLQGFGIGGKLIEFAIENGVKRLWALEKNGKAVRFYARHGFLPNGNRKPEDDTDEYLIELEHK